MMKNCYKTIYFFFTLLIVSSACNRNKSAQLIFNNKTVDLGNVIPGNVYEYYIMFQNKGDQSLIIKKVVGSCNCLNLHWPSKPILGNQFDTIFGSISISQRDTGLFRKEIMVYANTDSLFHKIDIIGTGIISPNR